MKKHENIPVLIRQMGENALYSTNDNLKYNCTQNLQNIKEYCDYILSKQNKVKK